MSSCCLQAVARDKGKESKDCEGGPHMQDAEVNMKIAYKVYYEKQGSVITLSSYKNEGL